MDTMLPMTAMKVAALLLLTLAVAACGVEMNEDAAKEDDDEDVNRHELVATFAGAYVADVTSDAFTCDRLVNAGVTEVELTVSDGPAAGLQLSVRAVGELTEGQALTPDNSDHERNFEMTLRTPTGATYRYGSLGMSPAGARGALTVKRHTDFTTAATLWVDGAKPLGGAPDAASLGAHVTFQCARWH